jgi:hypothetical protein
MQKYSKDSIHFLCSALYDQFYQLAYITFNLQVAYKNYYYARYNTCDNTLYNFYLETNDNFFAFNFLTTTTISLSFNFLATAYFYSITR